MRYVGVARRLVASLIDGLVSLLWTVPLFDVTHRPGYVRVQLTGWDFVAAVLLDLTYLGVMEGAVGASVGKFVVGIRVRQPEGEKIGAREAFVRNLLRIVDAFPYVIPYLVGAIAVWTSPRKQRLGDRVAGTVVVTARQEPAPMTGPVPATPGALPEAVPGALPEAPGPPGAVLPPPPD